MSIESQIYKLNEVDTVYYARNFMRYGPVIRVSIFHSKLLKVMYGKI